MNYEDYIKLGFERIDMSDVVQFKRKGYYGFALEKKINDIMMVCTDCDSLNEPKLYIRKLNSETWHIRNITTDEVIALFAERIDYFDYMTTAC
jgi:hypothetical protein